MLIEPLIGVGGAKESGRRRKWRRKRRRKRRRRRKRGSIRRTKKRRRNRGSIRRTKRRRRKRWRWRIITIIRPDFPKECRQLHKQSEHI